MVRLWPILVFAFVLSGCASAPAQHTPAGSAAQPTTGVSPASRFNFSGYPAAFKEGFGDACAKRRNEERFKADVDYQMGWSDGQSLCR